MITPDLLTLISSHFILMSLILTHITYKKYISHAHLLKHPTEMDENIKTQGKYDTPVVEDKLVV